MKSMGGSAWAVQHGLVTAEELLRYAMSLPVAVTICGLDSLEALRQNPRVARAFTPMGEAEMESLRARCAPTADGHLELFESTLRWGWCDGAGAARLSACGAAPAVIPSKAGRDVAQRPSFAIERRGCSKPTRL